MRVTLRSASLLALVGCALGCGHSSARQTYVSDDTTGGEFAAAHEALEPTGSSLRVSSGTIRRAAIISVLDRGLGRFLQGVRVDAAKDGKRFVGFRLLDLYSGTPAFQKVDLVPGDVVTAVNTLSVERPEQALRAFESLRTAPALIVDYLRDGQERRLKFVIED